MMRTEAFFISLLTTALLTACDPGEPVDSDLHDAELAPLDEPTPAATPAPVGGLAAEPDVQLGLDTLVAFYRDLAASALGAGREQLAFRHVADEIEARARTLGARRAAARVEAITSVFEGLDRNANPRVTMDALVYQLRHAH